MPTASRFPGSAGVDVSWQLAPTESRITLEPRKRLYESQYPPTRELKKQLRSQFLSKRFPDFSSERLRIFRNRTLPWLSGSPGSGTFTETGFQTL